MASRAGTAAGTAQTPRPADVVLLGGGGAAIIVLQHLAAVLHERRRAGGPEGAGGAAPPLRVVVVDPVDRLLTRPADRTWCSWWDTDDPILELLDPCVAAEWRRLEVVDRSGRRRVLDLERMRYVMVRSQDLYAHVAARVADLPGLLEVVHVAATVSSVVTEPGGVVVATPAGRVRAQVALDSRPAHPVRAASTQLLQHFRGEVLDDGGHGDPAAEGDDGRDIAVFMDFSVPQPPVGVAFGYRLPAPDGTTLVEYTEFSPAVLDDAGYAAALGAYRERLGMAERDVVHVEQGAIPMDDAVRAGTAGPRVVRIGGAGGAIRGSTGYAFAAMQRQAHEMVGALVDAHAEERPLLAATLDVHDGYYPRRHAWMDAVMLRALADGSLSGADFFPQLFARNPPQRVLRFLDGSTLPWEEAALMATSPLATMTVSAARDALSRARAAPRRTGGRRTRPRR